MSTVLYIKANPKTDRQSRTFIISESFVESYKEFHPADQVITLDLYKENIDFLSSEDINLHTDPTKAGKDHPVLKYAYQFLEADKYIFAEPLWNLGIPAKLKAYIDYICVNKVTFKYTEQGPVGLCQNKKAINITTRGGTYSEGKFAEWETGDRYLRTILTFLGVADFTTISAENLDVVGQNVDEIIQQTIKLAREKAKVF